MTQNFDEDAFLREVQHSQIMQEQREKVTFANGSTYEVPVKEQDDEIN